MKIYDRQTKEYIEITQYGQDKLKILYGSMPGRLLLRLVVSPTFSRIYGWWNSRPESAKKIPAFIVENKIKTEDFEERTYCSFNDYFTRKLRKGAREINLEKGVLISPADAKLLVYPIDEGTRLELKGRRYTLDELVAGRLDLSSFAGGYCLVYRLCMDDYHRYCFIDSGKCGERFSLRGKLHTVSPISKDYKIYQENSRVVNVLLTDHFDTVVQIEVGALLVGKIVNREVSTFRKGEEKGYFEPGGSTIIQLFRKGCVTIADDILEQSRQHIETKVRFGESVVRKE